MENGAKHVFFHIRKRKRKYQDEITLQIVMIHKQIIRHQAVESNTLNDEHVR